MPTKEEFAQLSLYVYKIAANGIEINRPMLPSPDWREIGYFPDDEAGFSYGVFQRHTTGDVVIAFGGSNERLVADFLLANLPASFGIYSPQVQAASLAAARVIKEYGAESVSFTGHSLGGGLASVVAVWYDRPAAIFDAAPFEMTARSIDAVLEAKKRLADAFITNESLKNYDPFGNFLVRETNVTGYFVSEEALHLLRLFLPTVTGTQHSIDFGIANMLKRRIELHSLALLTAGLMSDRFRLATVAVQSTLPMLADLYAYPAETSTRRNFLIDLIRSEQQSPGSGKLTHFASDLGKIGEVISGLRVSAQNTLIAHAMEWYYLKGDIPASEEFFSVNGEVLQYTTAKGNLLEGVGNDTWKWTSALLELEVVKNGGTYSRNARKDFDQWNIVGGTNGGQGSALSESKSQVFIGGANSDKFNGGTLADLILAGGGNDRVSGGGGRDVLYGGDGSDTYVFDARFGQDIIVDADGLGNVLIDATQLGKFKGAGRRGGYAFDMGGGQFAGLAVIDSGSSETGFKAVIVKGADTANTITIDNFDPAKALHGGYLGIELDSTPDVALVRGGGSNFWREIDADLGALQGRSSDVAKGAGTSFMISLSHGARAGAQLILHLAGLAGKGLKAILGDETVEADGAVISLAEGQTDVRFALVHDGELDGDAVGSLSVSYQGSDISANSNRWNISLEDSGEIDNTFTGDNVVETRTNGDNPIGRLGLGGAQFDVVASRALYFSRDAMNNLVRGTTEPTLVPIRNDDGEIIGYTHVPSDDVEVTDDTLYGSAGNDRIHGQTGNDLLAGNAGDDTINGGIGDDMIGGGAGNDRIEGGDGNDFISSSADIQPDRQQLGPDDRWSLWGSPPGAQTDATGAMWGVYPDQDDADALVWNGMAQTRTDPQSDSVDAGDGDDWVMGSWGDDRIQGGAGDDRLEGLAGEDILEGGDGDDRLDGDGLLKVGYQDSVGADRHGDDFIDGGAGADAIRGGGGSDNIFGGAGNDTVFADGSGASDSATFVDLQYHGEDYIDGEDGDDYVEGGGKDDTLYGGSGKDTLWGDTAAANLKHAAANDPLAWGSDYLDGEDGDDQLYGGGGSDTLYGGQGRDQLVGDDGAALVGSVHGSDYLDGEAGDDTLVGGGRDDTLFGGEGDDTLQGDAAGLDAELHGDDYIDGEAGDDFLLGQGGADELFGGEGDDELQGDGAAVAPEFHGADLLDGGDGADRLFGGGGDDRLFGGAGADEMSGDDGNDLVDGGDGADILVGGEGDDILQGGEAADIIDGGVGNDQIAGGAGDDDLNSGDGDDMIDGGAGDDRFGILGTHGNKILVDESGTDTLDLGWNLDDTELDRGSFVLRNKVTGQEVHIEGFDADDAAAVSPVERFAFALEQGGAMVLSAQQLIEQVGFVGNGTAGDDVINGTAFRDLLEGGAGDDLLAGNEGDDRLTGGAGADQMLGGTGDDVYVVAAQSEDTDDIIIEHENEGQDRVESAVDYILRADHVETVMLTGGQAINATGSDAADRLVGNAAANTLDGAAGADVLEGRDGDDRYRVDNGRDVVIEQAGQGLDTVLAVVDFVLPAHVENLLLEGDAAQGTGNGAANDLHGNALDNRLRGMDGDDRMLGGEGNDVYVVRTDRGTKTVSDSGGDEDVLDLGWNTYATHFVLGSTSDRLGLFNAATRQLVEIEGFDPLSENPVSAIEKMVLFVPIFGGFEQSFLIDQIFREQGLSFFGTVDDDTLTGTWRRDSLFGFQGDDTLLGLGGDDLFDGGLGADRMVGAAGDDTYIVDNPLDTALEVAGEGFDAVYTQIDYSLEGTAVEWLEMTSDDHRTGTGNELRNFMFASLSGSSLFGQGGNDEVFGRKGDDKLHGGDGNDHILGREGDDLLAGDGGDDELRADGGDDSLAGGSGDDQLFGAVGNDFLDGGSGEDALWGGDGDDALEGGEGSDVLRGEQGQDVLSGGDGNDTLLNSPGGDVLAGGAGDDIYREDTVHGLIAGFAASGTTIVEEADGGTDSVVGYESFTLGAHLENLTLMHRGDESVLIGIGNASSNRLESRGIGAGELFGLAGDDTLVGGAGRNHLDGGAGADLMIGGTGPTDYLLDDAGDWVVAHADGDTDTVYSSVDHVLGEFVENLVLTEGLAVVATGNALFNRITGNSSDNTIDGGAGSDLLSGGAGNDILIGTQGRDALLGDDGDDLLLGSDIGTMMSGGSGRDRLFGGAGPDELNGGSDADHMVGGAGDDVYVVDDAEDAVVEQDDAGTDSVVAFLDYRLSDALENLTLAGYGLTGIGNAAANVITGGDGGERMFGLDGDDLLDAGAGMGAWLDGGAGQDVLVSASGWVTLAGGEGDDLYRLGAGNVFFVERAGEGYDRVHLDAARFPPVQLELSDHVEELEASSATADLSIQAGADDNLIRAGSGNDTIDGGGGDDTLLGGHSRSATVSEYGPGIAGAMEEFFRSGAPVPRTFERLLADFRYEISQVSAEIFQPIPYLAWLVPPAAGESLEPVPLFVSAGFGRPEPTQALFIHPDGSLTWQGGGFLQDEVLANWEPRSGPLGWDDLQARYGLRLSVPEAESNGYLAITGNRIPSPEPIEGGPWGDSYSVIYWPKDRLPLDMQAALAAQLSSDDGQNDVARALAMTGADELSGGDGADLLDGGDGNDRLFGGAGNDVLHGGLGNGAVSVSVSAATEAGYASVVIARGEPENDDFLDGGAGADTMIGGSGDDWYHVDGEATDNPDGRVAALDWCDVQHRFGMDAVASATWITDSVVELAAEGHDTVIASASVVLDNVERVVLSDTAPVLDIDATTGAGAQALQGNAGRNTLDGGAGGDVMAGAGGDDSYVVDDAADVVIEQADAGQDLVRTTVDQYVLGDNIEALLLEGGDNLSASGNSSANILVGNRGDNALMGGAGDDVLAGWRGNDLLAGGEGFDYYLFARGDGRDTVDDADGSLHFSGDIRREELTFNASDNDLVISLAAVSGDDGLQVTLAGWLLEQNGRVEQITFCTDAVVAPIDEFVLMQPRDDIFEVAEGQARADGNLLDNDAAAVVRHRLTMDPFAGSGQFGTAHADESGTFHYQLDAQSTAYQALAQGQWATDALGSYDAFDNVSGRWLGAAGIEVEVSGVNDAPVAFADIAWGVEDWEPVVSGNVLANDQDVDADALAVSSVGTRQGVYGRLELAASGEYRYSLDNESLLVQSLGADAWMTEMFGYTMVDSHGAESAATLEVNVFGDNDAPITQSDTAAVGEDAELAAQGNVLANDTDPDASDTLAVSDAGSRQGQYGTLVIDSQGAYSYSLANGSGAVQSLTAGQQVTDIFSYTATDGFGASAAGQLVVQITGADDATGVTLTGTARNDMLVGTVHADVLNGARGSDMLIGGKGDDIYFVDSPPTECDGEHDDDDDRDGDDDDDDDGKRRGQGHDQHGNGHGRGHGDDDDRHAQRDSCGCESGDSVVELAGAGVDTVASTVDYVLPQNVEHLMLLGAAGRTGDGNALDNVIVASAGASSLSGGGGNDVLVGRSAGDRLEGGTGDDRLYGEAGNDKLGGGQGNDSLWGGTGHDQLDGADGDNLLAAGAGDDKLTAGSGSDIVVAGAGHDRIAAGGGNDFVDAGAGNDTIDGGIGSDFIAAGRGSDVITSGAGRDVIAFNRGDGQDTLHGHPGSAAADVLSLGGGIRYADLTLIRRGTDLVLGFGAADQVTSRNWYAAQDGKGIGTLQIVTVGGDYRATSSDRLVGNKVVAFDFAAIAQQYDAARKSKAVHGAWAVQPALAGAFLGASNGSALGGDLAFDYATTYVTGQSYGSDMTVAAIQEEARGLGGANWQAIDSAPAVAAGLTLVDPWVALQAGTDLVVSKEPGASNPVAPTESPMTDSLMLAALLAGPDSQQPTWAAK